MGRKTWKQNNKKFGKLKKQRQHTKLVEGQPMKRNIENPKTRAEDKLK